MNFRDLKIGSKLSIGFGLVTIILLSIGLTVIKNLNQLEEDRFDLIQSYEMDELMAKAKFSLATEMQIVMELLSCEETQELNDWWAKHEAEVDKYDQIIAALEEKGNDSNWGKAHQTSKNQVANKTFEIEKKHNSIILPT